MEAEIWKILPSETIKIKSNFRAIDFYNDIEWEEKRVLCPWKIWKHYVVACEDADSGKGVPCGTRTSACNRRADWKLRHDDLNY